MGADTESKPPSSFTATIITSTGADSQSNKAEIVRSIPLFLVALHLLILVFYFALSSPSHAPQAVHRTTSTNFGPKVPPNYGTTTATTTPPGADSQSKESLIVRILQREMDRKLEELHDVHKAFAFLITSWSEEKNPAANPSQHCYTVQQAWIRSDRTWNYRDRLEEAVKKIEGEITAIRKELAALALAQYGVK
ncbi:hypothetical protein BGX23_003509 [Mortierella sp. AD031]|nr:hypothetical protein BGX23_003509 [Mortierella sp. AD031]